MADLINSLLLRLLGLIFFAVSLPLLLVLFALTKIYSIGPFIFKQERVGKDKRIFTMYKIRTMEINAEQLKTKYLHLNEADGPVFKIRDDPRHTKVGKIISHLGLDELPQLINVIKGDMALVGPRPLSIQEGSRVPKKYSKRFSVLPGITSIWVIKGTHKLNFSQWMETDMQYIQNKSLLRDLRIIFQTLILIPKLLVNEIMDNSKKGKS